MLVAHLNGQRIEAAEALKGACYGCPECTAELILKKGRVVVHHFAHKPLAGCAYARGETLAHLSGKLALCRSFRARGLDADVERPVLSVAGDRRADVLVGYQHHGRRAIELQHSPIDLSQIEHRTAAYISAGVPVLWVPLLRRGLDLEDVDDDDGRDDLRLFTGDFEMSGYIERYTTPPWLRWLAGYTGDRGVWFYEAKAQELWWGRLSPCEIEVPEREWYDQYGDLQSSGGHSYPSTRWMRLDFCGPVELTDVRLAVWHRRPERTRDYNFPGGRVADFILPDEYEAVAGRAGRAGGDVVTPG